NLLDEIIARRADFDREADLRAALSVPDGVDEAALLGRVFIGGGEALILRILPVLAGGGSTDQQARSRLADLLPLTPSLAALSVLEDILLTGSGAKEPFTAKLGAFPTKALRQALGPVQADLERLMLRVEAVRP